MKQRHALDFPDDIDAYVADKDSFIQHRERWRWSGWPAATGKKLKRRSPYRPTGKRTPKRIQLAIRLRRTLRAFVTPAMHRPADGMNPPNRLVRPYASLGENMMIAMPRTAIAEPSRSQTVGRTPSTDHSHRIATKM